jgi:hypothetical protein
LKEFFEKYSQIETFHKKFRSCSLSNIGICKIPDMNKEINTLVYIQSPQMKTRELVEFEVSSPFYDVFDYQNKPVPNDLFCFMKKKNTNIVGDSEVSCKLFIETQLNSHAIQLYSIKPSDKRKRLAFQGKKIENCTKFKIGHDFLLQVKCNKDPSEMEIMYPKKGKFFTFGVSMKKYFTLGSGPYLFRPTSGTMQSPVNYSSELNSVLFAESDLLLELRFVYGRYIVKLVKYKNSLEPLEFEVTTIAKNFNIRQFRGNKDSNGLELVVDFKTSLVENKEFEVMANGLERRKISVPNFTYYVNDYNNDYKLGKCKNIYVKS